ncbi:type II secretion system F family protein [Alkalicella caledoniensis]|uniref:Type II secretion system F family protein n=1 Tax=Alkalicella caledoniensis TaxID=2731377 RepID=A0A7G9WBP5_ALKCA|nr:type II secretion system F family protein [Alkalicella caledoniensis]QNO16107.1 type II secretion system F family protein [Alkalicella caledoniensis]
MLFQYVAKNITGELIKGQLDAEDSKRALHLLREKNLFVLQLKRAQLQTTIKLFQRKVGVKDLALFCSQTSTMLKAGVSITRSLQTVADQTENKLLKDAVTDVIRELENGNTLTDSVKKREDVFPQIFVSLVEAGEAGGVLDTVLERLSLYFESEREIKEKVKSAMTYPMFIGGFALVALVFMLAFIVPNFVSMFDQMGAGDELPLITKILISSSEFLQRNIISLILLICATIFGMRLLLQKPNIRIWWDYRKTRMPVFGKLIKKIAVSRFCRTMSLMTASSVGIVTSLQLVSKAVDNNSFGEEILDVLVGIQEGGTLVQEFKKSRYLDNLTLQMLSVGEETGNLETMLEKIGVYHEQDVKYSTERLASLIEPLMIVVVAIFIGLILAAVLLPMFDMMQHI